MVGRDMEWRAYRQVCGQRGRNLTMTLAIHITYQMFSSAAARAMNTAWFFNFGDFLARARKKWIAILDKSVVFPYDGVPAHLDSAIPPHTYTAYAPLPPPLDFVEKDLSCLKATPKADISSPEI